MELWFLSSVGVPLKPTPESLWGLVVGGEPGLGWAGGRTCVGKHVGSIV